PEIAAGGDFWLAQVPGNPIGAGAATTAQRPIDPPLYDAAGTPRSSGTVDPGAFEGTPPLNFSFNLVRPGIVSAGAYLPDGTLVRTLWSARDSPAGANIVFWNGLDDLGRAVPEGTYLIKVIAHDMKYVWEGVIGNTS